MSAVLCLPIDELTDGEMLLWGKLSRMCVYVCGQGWTFLFNDHSWILFIEFPFSMQLTPSAFAQEMSQSTEERLANTHLMHPPRILELIDMTETTHQKVKSMQMHYNRISLISLGLQAEFGPRVILQVF